MQARKHILKKNRKQQRMKMIKSKIKMNLNK